MSDDLEQRIRDVQRAIAEACAEAGRPQGAVRLVAVSKTQGPARVEAAYAAGLRDFGENYAQEASEKHEATQRSCPDARWHFVGRVQRNKVKLLQGMTCIHGVGDVAQLQAISQRLGAVDVLLQVNESREEQKNGFFSEQLLTSFEQLLEVPKVRVRGLMSLPAPLEAEDDQRRHFAAVRGLRDALEREFDVSLPELSLGMSHDFRAAILEGATLVRIGTALFGPRAPRVRSVNPPDPEAQS